jgi:hypothetical protein
MRAPRATRTLVEVERHHRQRRARSALGRGSAQRAALMTRAVFAHERAEALEGLGHARAPFAEAMSMNGLAHAGDARALFVAQLEDLAQHQRGGDLGLERAAHAAEAEGHVLAHVEGHRSVGEDAREIVAPAVIVALATTVMLLMRPAPAR